MKTKSEFIKGLLLFVYGVLNMIPGVAHFVPAIKKAADGLQAKTPSKVMGYLPILITALIIYMSYSGGISKEDKDLIKTALDSAKVEVIVPVDTAKVDTLKK